MSAGDLAPSERPVFLYHGRKCDSLEQLRSLCSGNKRPLSDEGMSKAEVIASAQKQLEKINLLLSNTHKFDVMVATLFTAFVGNKLGLHQHEAIGLMMSLGAEIGCGDLLCMFDEVRHLFYRFDFNGNEELDEAECKKLVSFILRKARDKLAPPSGLRLLNLPRKNLDGEYRILKQLGQGGQGAVYLAEKKGGGQPGGNQRVVKFYSKADANAPLDDIKEEFRLLTKLDHPLIARVLDIFEDSAKVYVVSEPYYGGDLTQLISKAYKNGTDVTVQWIGRVLKQVLEALSFLHQEMVMHCDIKEPNIMIANDFCQDEPRVVLIDFGMAKDFGGSRQGGTPGYMPPEVWQLGLWSAKGDIFSLAMVFWGIFNGRVGGPFYMVDAPPFTKIRMATIHNAISCSQLPPGLAEVTENMADKDFKKRMSARQVLTAPFFQDLDRSSPNEPLDAKALKALNNVADKNGLQNIMATELLKDENLAQLHHLNELFLRLDSDNSGTVQEDEARAAFAHLGFSRVQTERMVSALVGDGSVVHYSDFMAKLLLAQTDFQEEHLASAFASIDKDSSGTLDIQEIEAMLDRPQLRRLLNGRTAAAVMNEMDSDRNGVIDFEEFRRAMLGELVQSPPRDHCWSVGDAARYYSRSRNAWVPCKVVEVNYTTGDLQLDIKPNQVMPLRCQEPLLAKGWVSWKVGDACRYYCKTEGKFMEGTVAAVQDESGAVALASNPQVWLPAWTVCEPKPVASGCLRCPGGHRLKKLHSSLNRILECDRCSERVKAGALMFSCRPCHYDLCGECAYATKERVEAAPVEDEPVLVAYEAVVVRENVAQDESQLSLQVGDVVQVTEEHASGWIGGHKDGDEMPGWFPGFCVQRRDAANIATAASGTSVATTPLDGTALASLSVTPSPGALSTRAVLPESSNDLVSAPTQQVLPAADLLSPFGIVSSDARDDHRRLIVAVPTPQPEQPDDDNIPTARVADGQKDSKESKAHRSALETAHVSPSSRRRSVATPSRQADATPSSRQADFAPSPVDQLRTEFKYPCQSLRTEFFRLQAELKEAQQELTAVHDELSGVHAELSEERGRRARAEERVRECAKALEVTKEAIEGERKKKEAEIAALREQHRKEQEQRIKLQEQVEALNSAKEKPLWQQNSAPLQAKCKKESAPVTDAKPVPASASSSAPPQFTYAPAAGSAGFVRTQISLIHSRGVATAPTMPVSIVQTAPAPAMGTVPCKLASSVFELVAQMPPPLQLEPRELDDEDGECTISPLPRIPPAPISDSQDCVRW